MSNKSKKFTITLLTDIILDMNREILVSKFGGSSMANAESIGLVIGIVNADPRRHVIVVSAPGRDGNYPEKTTDLLLGGRFGEVRDRFHQLGKDLGWRQRDQRIAEVMEELRTRPSRIDYGASRGEYLTARMMADLLGAEFVDAKRLISISMDNTAQRSINDASYENIDQLVGSRQDRIVVPGFYGVDRKGWIRTLPRDGSDITGAVITRGLRAQTYEIFSDTNGIMTADPNQDPNALFIPDMTYAELAALTETGAKIVHPQVARILRGRGIAINCRNTFASDHSGTWIRD